MRKVFLIGTLLLLASCGTAQPPYQASILEMEKKVEGNPELKAVATLRTQEGEIGNGFAELQCWSDHCIHTMRVNLVPRKEGHYQAWLILKDGIRLPTGVLEPGEKEGSYFLIYESSALSTRQIALPKSVEAIVSWEPPNDEQPDALYNEMLHGTFTIVEGGL